MYNINYVHNTIILYHININNNIIYMIINNIIYMNIDIGNAIKHNDCNKNNTINAINNNNENININMHNVSNYHNNTMYIT